MVERLNGVQEVASSNLAGPTNLKSNALRMEALRIRAILLVGLNGVASHLVSYDEHLKDMVVFYPEFITCEPVGFFPDLHATLLP